MYQLREYQSQSVDAVWDWLCAKPSGNPCIELPTAAGKSLVAAEFVRRCLSAGKRILVLAHRKELLEQNAEKIRSLLPGLDVGVYSAGLRSRDTESQVVVAGVQSVAKRAFDFGEVHAVLIDEAHLVSDKDGTQYQQFLADLKVANPKLRVIGMTATPYRLDSGLIYGPEQLFHEICHRVEIGPLIKQGFLCPLISTPALSEADTTNLHQRGGEFIRGELESLFGDGTLVRDSCNEIIQKSWDRHSVIVFCSGVDHAQFVKETISHMTGQEVGLVTGETPSLERVGVIDLFKNQRLKYLVSVDCLTTGFDAPCIDCVALLRATLSPGLFYQMVGRGLRLHDSKEDTLILDFGGNIARHGAIDSPDFGAKAKAKARGVSGSQVEGPAKPCPACKEQVPAGMRECYCGWKFPPPETSHDAEVDENNPILETTQPPEHWVVDSQRASRHRKRSASDDDPSTLRIDYECRLDGAEGNLTSKTISEWVCIEHSGWARSKAEMWWSERSRALCPKTVDEAVDLFDRGAVARSRSIVTKKDGQWYRITSSVIEDKPEEWSDVDDVDVYGEEVPF